MFLQQQVHVQHIVGRDRGPSLGDLDLLVGEVGNARSVAVPAAAVPQHVLHRDVGDIRVSQHAAPGLLIEDAAIASTLISLRASGFLCSEGCRSSAPASHPIKAKESSGIFHVPGGRFYDRTKPDRCYPTAAAAEADGYRRSKT